MCTNKPRKGDSTLPTGFARACQEEGRCFAKEQCPTLLASPWGLHTSVPTSPRPHTPKRSPGAAPGTRHPGHGTATHHEPPPSPVLVIPLELWPGEKGEEKHSQGLKGVRKKKNVKKPGAVTNPIRGQIKTIVQEEPNPQQLTIHTRLETLL